MSLSPALLTDGAIDLNDIDAGADAAGDTVLLAVDEVLAVGGGETKVADGGSEKKVAEGGRECALVDGEGVA